MPLATAAVGLGPALIPVLAGATAGAAGLGVAVASGGAALGVFGAVAKASFKDVQDNAKLAKKGTEELTTPLGRATLGYIAMGDAWDRFVKKNQPAVFTAMGRGFGILTTALPKLQPLFDVASRAVGGLEAQLSRFVSGGGLDRTVRFLAANAGPALAAFQRTLTNLAHGVGYLAPLFARFSGGVEVGMVRLSAAFANWAKGAGPSGGFQRFLDYVVATTPDVVSTLKELAAATVNLAKGLAPLGPLSLSFVGTIARLVAALPPGAITAIAAGFISLQLAMKLAAVASDSFNISIGRSPIGAIALALGALITLFLKHSQAVADSRAKTEAYAGTLNKTTSALTTNTTAMAANNLEASGAYAAADQLGIAYYTVTQAALGNKAAIAEVNAKIHEATTLTQEQINTGSKNYASTINNRDAAAKLSAAIGDANGQIAGAVEKNKRLYDATHPATAALAKESDAATTTARQMNVLAVALLHVAGINLNAAQTDLQFRDSLHALTLSVHANGRSLSENTVKGRANRAAVLDSISAALQHAEAVHQQTGSQVRAQQAFQDSIPAIKEQARKLHLNKKEVDDLIRSIGGLKPRTVSVLVRITGTDVTPTPGSAAAARIANQMGSGGRVKRAAGGWMPGYSPSDRADNIPTMMTAGEYVVQRPTARKLERLAPGFLDALNAGQLDIGGDRAALRIGWGRALRRALGGSIPSVQSWIRAQDPDPYIWGAAGPYGYDCSGLVGAVYGKLTGRGGGSGQRYFTTDTIGAGQGFRSGLGMFSVGVTPGRGHMAGQLGRLKFEARSTAAGIIIGQAATSPTAFARHFYLPQIAGGFGGAGGLTTAQIHRVVGLIRPAIVAGLLRELGLRRFDSGGYLEPGLNLAYNGTGRRERVTPTGGGDIHVHVAGPVYGMPHLVAEVKKGVVEALRSQGKISLAQGLS